MLRRVLLLCFLACLASVAWGQDFGLDLGCCSDPLTGAPITVDNHGGGTFGYFNSLDTQITELTFNVNVGTSFNDSNVRCVAFDYFVCQTPTFNSVLGILTFEFLAPNPPETGELADGGPTSTDTESGEGEGVPTLLAGCAAHPDTGSSTVNGGDGLLPCTYKGHFEVSFNTFGGGFESPLTYTGCNETSTTCLDSGAWNPGTTAALVTVNGKAIPEPSSLYWIPAGLLLIVGLGRYRRQRV